MSAAKLEKGQLVVDTMTILANLTGESRRTLIEMMACEDKLFEEVVSQLLTGYTTDGSSIWSEALKKARCRLLDQHGLLLFKAVDDIMAARDHAVENVNKPEQELRILRDAWPVGTDGRHLPHGKLKLHQFSEVECEPVCSGKAYEHGPEMLAGPPYNVTHTWDGPSLANREAAVSAILAQHFQERPPATVPDEVKAYQLGRRIAGLQCDLRVYGPESEQGKKLTAELEPLMAEFEKVRYA